MSTNDISVHGYTGNFKDKIINVLFNSKLLEEREKWRELFSRLGPSWEPDVSSNLNRTIVIMNNQRTVEAVWECDILLNIASLHYVYIANFSMDLILSHVDVLISYLSKTTRFVSVETANQIGFKVFIYISQNFSVNLPLFTLKRKTNRTILGHSLPMEYQEHVRKLYFNSFFEPIARPISNPFKTTNPNLFQPPSVNINPNPFQPVNPFQTPNSFQLPYVNSTSTLNPFQPVNPFQPPASTPNPFQNVAFPIR